MQRSQGRFSLLFPCNPEVFGQLVWREDDPLLDLDEHTGYAQANPDFLKYPCHAL